MNKWILGVVVALLAVAMLRRRGESVPPLDLGGVPPTEADIDRLIASGRKIEAIKVYRHLHGGDLKDAKDAVEARAKKLPGASG
jgi:ribosomal protein L7/L12